MRRVATSLFMVAILLSGILAYRQLPLSALPQVDYPTIQVVTFYPGASPEVTTSSITAPLERQFGQMPGLRQMSSTSSGGSSVVTLQSNREDVRQVIVQANVTQAKGSFDGPQRAYTIDANDQIKSADEYRRIIVADRNGAPLVLSDVADVLEDAENVRLAAWMNEMPAVIMNIQRQPGANVIEVVDRVKKLLPQLQATLPPGVDLAVLTDRTVTIRASVRDVQIELFIAIALVVMVIFLFFRTAAGTILPSIAVPLSLVGTFGVMYLAGFSINNLTLMALTIATGFVVDDAIVMIENIARYVEQGEPPMQAALKGAEQIA